MEPIVIRPPQDQPTSYSQYPTDVVATEVLRVRRDFGRVVGLLIVVPGLLLLCAVPFAFLAGLLHGNLLSLPGLLLSLWIVKGIFFSKKRLAAKRARRF
jgi:hypothetical protein